LQIFSKTFFFQRFGASVLLSRLQFLDEKYKKNGARGKENGIAKTVCSFPRATQNIIKKEENCIK
jgi:hypothetical protein